MNEATQQEEFSALLIVREAQRLVALDSAMGFTDPSDQEAATMALLMAASQAYAEQIGMSWKRLVVEHLREDA